MKKTALALSLGALLLAGYWLSQSKRMETKEPMEGGPKTEESSISSATQVASQSGKSQEPGEKAPSASGKESQRAIALFTKILGQEMQPEQWEALAKSEGLSLSQAKKGHPKTGQRLELTIESEFPIQAVFDIMPSGEKQLQAARMVFPQESSMQALKQDIKSQVSRTVKSESEESLIFADDAKGQTLWFGRTPEGKIQMALELNIHPHEHDGP